MQDQFVISNADTFSDALEEKIARFAKVPHYVLITGERGTGKTTIAKRLHELSDRRNTPFVNLNCASFSAELLESELFGYEKGAFTGATTPKAGLFEICSGGTLFLDEIGELSHGLQAKLLKAVEEKRIRRVGGTSERSIEVRVIAATSRDLLGMVRNGEFRPDLFDRLNILQLETIPLRHQRERIESLLNEQLEKERTSVGRTEPFVIDKDAMRFLQALEWKGNYRELRNFATRLAVDAFDEGFITLENVKRLSSVENDAGISKENPAESKPIQCNLITITLDPEKDDLETIYIKAAATFIEHTLKHSNGSFRGAARSLGITHSTISRILKKRQNQISDFSHNQRNASFAAAA
ncbi:MAG: sigma-54-dependent Fis family transcriptional regulator [Chloracidobacterium sp.]|nr:sigma-54-dependent Fis family transcriptional regulator [Chloracidobacterium sp.]